MVKVILDANFLFIPFQFRVDIFEELEDLVAEFEPVVLSATLEELESLAKKRSAKTRRQALAALELVERCKVIKVERKPDENNDDIILRTAIEWKCPVATNDKTLRKRLREERLTTVFLRQKTRLEIEGCTERLWC